MLEKMSEFNLMEHFANKLEEFLPAISMDCVLFGFREDTLQVLLLKWKNADAWTLPGGFLGKDEEMEQAVSRVLFERTGLTDIFLSQFHVFSSLHRGWNQDEFNQRAFNLTFDNLSSPLRKKIEAWFSQRFITTGFLAMVDINKVSLVPDYLSDTCEWKSIEQLPPLIQDHNEIIEKALQQLKIQLNYLPIGWSLLPEKFTMRELQSLYEAILQKTLDRGNFQRKMKALNILQRHEKLMTGAANKAPYLYSFDKKVYFKLLEEGIGFSVG